MFRLHHRLTGMEALAAAQHEDFSRGMLSLLRVLCMRLPMILNCGVELVSSLGQSLPAS
jgi:hypothetical protein